MVGRDACHLRGIFGGLGQYWLALGKIGIVKRPRMHKRLSDKAGNAVILLGGFGVLLVLLRSVYHFALMFSH
ncbi:hypothetical protein METH_06975 [Leisingera methylohalidivorans DSM 14336]|uniref:Uncharacterized protein n=1 Tax=Leisingera methylohalidivorans DSM 14336 TaxID=999552 RepID=V9VYE1_9RHOB|nr:hypothetical protein METH_06975 [Leisingera methylohalidivorans DSM 14336]